IISGNAACCYEECGGPPGPASRNLRASMSLATRFCGVTARQPAGVGASPIDSLPLRGKRPKRSPTLNEGPLDSADWDKTQ
ncbi:unnamed protein product, partial [Sphagnum tenellum]